jgi:hypothetical protein
MCSMHLLHADKSNVGWPVRHESTLGSRSHMQQEAETEDVCEKVVHG